jgi:hypothetical protein
MLVPVTVSLVVSSSTEHCHSIGGYVGESRKSPETLLCLRHRLARHQRHVLRSPDRAGNQRSREPSARRRRVSGPACTVRHVDALGIRASPRRLGSLEAKQQHRAGAPSFAVEAALDAATESEPRVRAARAARHVPNAISQRAALPRADRQS